MAEEDQPFQIYIFYPFFVWPLASCRNYWVCLIMSELRKLEDYGIEQESRPEANGKGIKVTRQEPSDWGGFLERRL
jgi:hypothetical protein